MSFLTPLAFAVFALALPLVLLYFLKVRRREKTVSSLLLWDTSLRDLTVDPEALRGYRERLRHFLERVESFCRSQEIGYHRVITDTPVEAFVVAQLRGRVLG